MARLYGPHSERIWREALLLSGQEDLLLSLAEETANGYEISREEALRRMEESWRDRAARLAAFPVHGSPEQQAKYYSGDDGVFRSMYWHSLRADRYPLHAVAGLHMVQLLAEGRRVFELGHGVGSAAILFERHGFEMTLGDVSNAYRAFAAGRLAARRLPQRFVDLTVEEPEHEAFDAVVSFDVLEHVPDPFASLELVRRSLRDGGVLVMNVAFGLDQENPEHLIRRRRGLLDKIRGLGFERVAHPSLLVFYRRNVGRPLRTLYRAQDTVAAVTDDVSNRWQRLGRMVRTHRTPGL